MKHCYFCTNNIKEIDYKNTEILKKFIDPFARIVPKKRTSVCSSHQRQLTRSIKRARFLALLPFTNN